MPAAARPCTARRDRADQRAARRTPTDSLILGACRSHARTVRQLAQALSISPEIVRRHVQRLLSLELLVAEAPSRHAGRLVTPYRTRVFVP